MTVEALAWRTERRKLSDLTPFEGNPRKLTQEQAEQIEESLRRFGLVEPPAVNVDGTIIGGHMRQRIMAAMDEFGPDAEIDVRVPSRELDDHELAELNIRLNKNTGDWDMEILAEEFNANDLVEWGFREVDFGYTVQEAPEFPEYDESVEEEVEMIECPACGHRFPA